MKFILSVTLVFIAGISFAQSTVRVDGSLGIETVGEDLGQITIFSSKDSSLVKGSYIDSTYFTLLMDTDGESEFYAKIKLFGYSDTLVAFTVEDTLVNLGIIALQKDLTLDEFEFVYREPLFERTIDGIEVNVEGTTLETLDNLFEILKASPKLSSPDDESIEIIGKGTPLILVDRQPILTNDELKAIPAEMVEKIEIITNPSAKYRAQGRGSGVIEVYTKDFRLQGYNMNINANGGLNTQLKPQGRLGVGFSFKKKKFSLNAYLSGNFRSQYSYGFTETVRQDSSLIETYSNQATNGWNIWQHFSLKSAYSISDKQKLTAGFRGGGSINNGDSESQVQYFQDDVIQTSSDETSTSSGTWLNNSAFLNYNLETDTNKSNLEVNFNYQFKINEDNSTNQSVFTDPNTSTFYAIQNVNRNRPNIAEGRFTYEKIFDTTGWKLSTGGTYSIIFNKKRFDQSNLIDGEWEVDPNNSNSYDYTEQIGGVFIEGTKKWSKLTIRAGITGEFTSLNGYSNSLEQQFIDSNYILPFPSASIMYSPNMKVNMTLRYTSGINRPSFSNYDPFVRQVDSLTIRYGNPYLRPSIRQSIGYDLDLFFKYGVSVDVGMTQAPTSTLTFVDDDFLYNSTPWNSDKSQYIGGSIRLPLKTKWMSGWNSIWFNYTKYYFLPEFQREDFTNFNFGLWSNLSFYLPHDFTIINRTHLSRWGGDSNVGNVRVNWGMRLQKKFKKPNMRIFIAVDDIIPPKWKNRTIGSNFERYSEDNWQFTAFKVGMYVKFGRLKQETNIKESKSGQSNRI